MIPVEPTREDILRGIETQTCPWCGKGGLKALAKHTVQAHGVSAAYIRDRAGLLKSATICSEGHSQEMREYALIRPLTEGQLAGLTRGRVGKHVLSEAGRASLEGRRREATRKMSAKHRDRVHRAALLYVAGTPINQIAAALGVHPGTVRQWRQRGLLPRR